MSSRRNPREGAKAESGERDACQAKANGPGLAGQPAVSKEPKKKRTPRVDEARLLRGTFALDVFTCAWCGGRGRVSAYLTAPNASSVRMASVQIMSSTLGVALVRVEVATSSPDSFLPVRLASCVA